MILTFLLGGVFGIVGLVGYDGVPVIRFIFGSANLQSANPLVIGNGDVSGYLDTCINRNYIYYKSI